MPAPQCADIWRRTDEKANYRHPSCSGGGGRGVYAYRSGFGRTPDDRILVSGNIELTEVNIAFKTAGRLIERTVDEGDAVKKGQVVARLDRDQLVAQRDREAAGLASAEAQLAQAETSLEWESANLAGDVEQRKADLASNESHLLELKNGSRPQEIQESRAAVEAAQSELDRAKRDWDRAQTLYKNDDISTEQYDQYRNRWQSADAALKQAQQRDALVQAGPRVEVVEAAAGASGEGARGVEDGGSEHARDQAARAGAGHAAGRNRARQGQPGADRLAACRYHRLLRPWTGWCW